MALRVIAALFLLTLAGCTGEWGDWMQADKEDEDPSCDYYKNCGDKDSAHDALYGASKGGDSGANSHSNDTAHVDAPHDSGDTLGHGN